MTAQTRTVRSLADAEFLGWRSTQAVFFALGTTGIVRVVGGSVRNALLGEPVTDIDLATVLPPQEVIKRAEAAGLKAVPTGLDHGTVTVVAFGRPFEVTTLRADVETDGRHAVVRFTTDWAEDAARRDFTMNALYCDHDGELFDPLGGYDDLVARQIRFIGDAEDRIREDYLRILRFFRFFAWYGHGRPDAEGLKASARLKGGIATLSAERIWAEMKRLMGAPDPTRAMLWMRTTEVLQRALPESWGIDALHGMVEAEKAEGWIADPLLRLESILPPHRARIDALAQRLRLSRGEQERLLDWADAETAAPDLSEAELARQLYGTSRNGVVDRLKLALASERAKGNEASVEGFRRQLNTAEDWQKPVFPVTGKDLLARGVKPGPEMGERLREMERRWIDSEFTLDRDTLLGA
ncbi:poly(A) polymerase/tRNA nucleotidyltransferase (CCA-adding enzyme) [Faunimonas pinastri]|uniref:Poly(A) polymerase/tRNA nucleotidyltransferase (CCA-adding enzyme) n=1 Tax=Faunimonas pinastri TaxID=1855383 RepID=A0A1H9AEH0_9HYPH|nr:CCA tRNA nucleotidyltransferase [Faunimonas pinastri]SEP74887.1 poly(A) polymerase/tRNA nucleotidyltransferase (CCA-adding enzyme) [Faunimonas pinastri]